MVKYYYRHELLTKDADELLALESALRNNQSNETDFDQDVIFLGSSNDQNLAEKSLAFLEELQRQSGHLSPDNARVYNSIFVRLFEMQINDSKNTQHRHIYRVSNAAKIFLFLCCLTLIMYYRCLGCTIIYIIMQRWQNLN